MYLSRIDDKSIIETPETLAHKFEHNILPNAIVCWDFMLMKTYIIKEIPVKILRVPCNKEWFQKIKNGELLADYREVKPYWNRKVYESGWIDGKRKLTTTFRVYDIVEFKMGYSADAPILQFKFTGFSIQPLFNKGNFYVIHFGTPIEPVIN